MTAGRIPRASMSACKNALLMASSLLNYMYSKLIEQTTWLNASDPVPEKRISPIDHPQRS